MATYAVTLADGSEYEIDTAEAPEDSEANRALAKTGISVGSPGPKLPSQGGGPRALRSDPRLPAALKQQTDLEATFKPEKQTISSTLGHYAQAANPIAGLKGAASELGEFADRGFRNPQIGEPGYRPSGGMGEGDPVANTIGMAEIAAAPPMESVIGAGKTTGRVLQGAAKGAWNMRKEAAAGAALGASTGANIAGAPGAVLGSKIGGGLPLAKGAIEGGIEGYRNQPPIPEPIKYTPPPTGPIKSNAYRPPKPAVEEQPKYTKPPNFKIGTRAYQPPAAEPLKYTKPPTGPITSNAYQPPAPEPMRVTKPPTGPITTNAYQPPAEPPLKYTPPPTGGPKSYAYRPPKAEPVVDAEAGPPAAAPPAPKEDFAFTPDPGEAMPGGKPTKESVIKQNQTTRANRYAEKFQSENLKRRAAGKPDLDPARLPLGDPLWSDIAKKVSAKTTVPTTAEGRQAIIDAYRNIKPGESGDLPEFARGGIVGPPQPKNQKLRTSRRGNLFGPPQLLRQIRAESGPPQPTR